jgi:hypothetical protein
MKIKILLSAWVLLVGATAYAQNEEPKSPNRLHVGISGGYTYNQLVTSIGYRPFTTYEEKGGFTVGLPVVYRVADWFSLQVEPSVVQKNYLWRRTEYYNFEDLIYPRPHQLTTNTYLQLPLLAHFSFGGEKLRGFCAPGAFAGYWAGSHIKGIMLDGVFLPYEYDEAFTFDSRRDKRLEYGLLLGMGLEYTYNNLCTFVLEGRYYHGLSDLQKDYMLQQTPRYNSTYALQLGVLFNLASLF